MRSSRRRDMNWAALLAAVTSLLASLTAGSFDSLAEDSAGRVRTGLQVLYDFRDADGLLVKDRSGVGEPLDLKIENPRAVGRTPGALTVRGQTLIRSAGPAQKVIDAVKRSGAISIEAWVRPAKANQTGPARIVTLSKNGNERNFTLGHDGNRFDFRLRTTSTTTNGIPSLSSPGRSLTTKLIHVVYTRNRSGAARLYLDGQQRAQKRVRGSTSNWDGSYRLGIGNELSQDRLWLGTFHLVAVYSRDLSPNEVGQNFRAGADGETARIAQRDQKASHFETRVAPLLAQHCLECHDAATHEGGLDLSKKATALAGGDSGAAIVAGKPAASPLWEAIELDEMPKDRVPLSPEDKLVLRDWINSGATWSLDAIDPAVYTHDIRVAKNWVNRLTVNEYIDTVRAAVDVDIAKEARRILPPDLRADGFSNTAYNLNVDLKHVEAYAQLAEIIVSRMDTVTFAARFSRSRKLTDDNMRDLISKMGKWLLRGPLDEREVVIYRGISTTVASAGGDFRQAVGYFVEAMLQSPRFIYRMENQRGDGTAWPVDQYELASRLSYIIWGGPPDEALIRSADAGELDLDATRAHAKRMLQDPRAVKRSHQFASEWLNLNRLQNLRPNRDKFPDWDDALAADMRAETLAYFHEVVWEQQRPLADLLNAQVTHVTPRLARHYGLAAPPDAPADQPVRLDLSQTASRGGLLTQGSVLTVGGDEASMVTRGLLVLHDLLRGVVKDPPPCVEVKTVPSKPGLTQRGIAEARLANQACGGCHIKFEPLAFGLEKFDGLGVYHDVDEHGNRLREDGEILFPGEAQTVAYRTSAELMDLLAGSDRVRQSITWKLTQFALGRPLVAADARTVNRIHHAAQQAGGTYAGLITAIVVSDLVQMTRTEH